MSRLSKLASNSPLRHQGFLLIWMASTVGNLGSEMRNTGSAWLMTSLNPSPIMVSLIQAALTLPIVLFAIPAGALSDVVDRRKIIWFSLGWMTLSVLALGVLSFIDSLSSGMLIFLTVCLGIGTAASAPAWDPIISEITPRNELSKAIALSAASGNVIRAVGPAIAGLLISYTNLSFLFFINAAAFIFAVFAIARWKPEKPAPIMPPENVLGAMTAGLKYVWHSPILHSLFLRTVSFVFPACALWALLPLVVREHFRRGPAFYGLLLACFGIGSALGSIYIQKLKKRFSVEAIAATDSVLFGLALVTVVYSHSVIITMLALVVAGAAWLTSTSSVATGVQISVPSWVRARATAVTILVTCASLAGGSIVWGAVASLFGNASALLFAATLLMGSAPLYLYFGLRWEQHSDLSPVFNKQLPHTDGIHLEHGPVLVTVEYHIDPQQIPHFLKATHELRRLRLRDGAAQWGIFRDVSDPSRLIETFLVKSWAEHIRLHARTTVADIKIEECVGSFHLAETSPFVNHFISGDSVLKTSQDVA